MYKVCPINLIVTNQTSRKCMSIAGIMPTSSIVDLATPRSTDCKHRRNKLHTTMSAHGEKRITDIPQLKDRDYTLLCTTQHRSEGNKHGTEIANPLEINFACIKVKLNAISPSQVV